MESAQPVVAAIFDLDGTLLDTESVARRAWEAVGLRWGVHVAPTMIGEMTGKRYVDLVGVIAKWYGPEFPSQAFLESCNEDYRRECGNGIELKEGVGELLDRLEGWGIPKIVATSSQLPRARQKLAEAGLLDRFADVVSGDEVVNGKPAPDVFEEAARRLGMTGGRFLECVVFEDSLPGVDGALAAGMQVVWIPEVEPVGMPGYSGQVERVDLLGASLLDSIPWLAERVRSVNTSTK